MYAKFKTNKGEILIKMSLKDTTNCCQLCWTCRGSIKNNGKSVSHADGLSFIE